MDNLKGDRSNLNEWKRTKRLKVQEDELCNNAILLKNGMLHARNKVNDALLKIKWNAKHN